MPKREYSVYIDSAAYDRMFMHVRFLAQVSVSAAERLYDALEKAMNSLKHTPAVCPPYMAKFPTDAELRYKLCAKRYRIVFEIIGNAVYVYDIQDCRQDTDKNLV
jgi:plasmid stabilization system protein ParE